LGRSHFVLTADYEYYLVHCWTCICNAFFHFPRECSCKNVVQWKIEMWIIWVSKVCEKLNESSRYLGLSRRIIGDLLRRGDVSRRISSERVDERWMFSGWFILQTLFTFHYILPRRFVPQNYYGKWRRGQKLNHEGLRQIVFAANLINWYRVWKICYYWWEKYL